MKRSTLVYLIIILAAIVAVMVFFRKCGKDPITPVIITPKELVKKVEKSEAATAVKTDSLAKANALHQAEERRVKKLLADANDKIGQLKGKLSEVVNHPPAQVPSEYTEVLKVSYTDYTRAIETKDSLHNEELATLDAQLRNRDALITVKDSSYADLRRSFLSATDNLQASIDYSKQLKKQVRKKKVGIIVWKVAAIAGSLVILKQAIQ